MCEWEKNNLPRFWMDSFEYADDESYNEMMEQIAEDVCKEHSIFCCKVCFDTDEDFCDPMEMEHFRCEKHNQTLCEMCFDWNVIQREESWTD